MHGFAASSAIETLTHFFLPSAFTTFPSTPFSSQVL